MKKKLMQAAKKLKQPSAKSAKEFADVANVLIPKINQSMSVRKDIESLIGKNNIDMMKDNHSNHVRFMNSVFADYEPEILVETVIWVFKAYRAHGFNLSYWPAQLNNWLDLFKENLSEDCYNEIYPFYEWMLLNQSLFVLESDK